MSKNDYLTEKKNQSEREGDGLKLIQTGRGSSKGGCALHLTVAINSAFIAPLSG